MSWHLGQVTRPKPGCLVNGDLWLCVERTDGTALIGICDGLGSGEPAREAADAFDATVRTHADRPVAEILSLCHTALLGTRGAAGALLQVDATQRLVSYAGVGNIECRTRRDWEFHPLSARGIIGAGLWREPRVSQATYHPGEWLILHSDGLRGRFDLEYELTRLTGIAQAEHRPQVR
ncbi:MAG TPA: hypothetical protein DCZ72_09025, partial [Armatimonadetes bacterium]|nr:hypothetical protein [Armatimonadota bacterium]